MFDHVLDATPADYLDRMRPDVAVLFFCPEVQRNAIRRFTEGFPGLVTYAVKANPAPCVLDVLVDEGVRTFDVASPAEMRAVRRHDANAVLHYNNPVRSRAEIAEAERMGIVSASADDMAGIDELTPLGCEIAVRFRLDLGGAAYHFGSKFGATPDRAVELLAEAAKRGGPVALTYHPGTQCTVPETWGAYVRTAADIARRAGVTLDRLNVGGGFPAHRFGDAPDLQAIFDRISGEARAAFGSHMPDLVCEPGRAICAEALTIATRVKAIRDGGFDEAIFLNDGIYGGLSELRDIGPSDRIRVLSADGTPRRGRPRLRTVFGPTCDSLDRLPGEIALPEDIEEDDYVLFDGMGAYSLALSTGFNGYGLDAPVPVARLV